MEPDKRTILITGAGRGIGRAITLAFTRQGCHTILVGRNPAHLQTLKSEIEALGAKATLNPADLSVREQVVALAAKIESQEFRPDVLINNAAIGTGPSPRHVREFDVDFWDYTLMLNLTTPFLICRAALPQMLQRGYGRIINIASVASRVGLHFGAAYAASKHGLLGLTRTIALETAGSGVTANAICPGPVSTDSHNERLKFELERQGKTFAQLEKESTPSGRRISPEEVAALAAFLAGEAASIITGQAYNIDGGLNMA